MKIKNLFYALFLFPFYFASSQTLEGTSGLFFIPTAEMQKDGTVLIGANFVNKELISFSGYQQNAFTPYLTLTFLPFAEFSIKITRYTDENVGGQALGDRTFSARIKIYNEQNIIPALVLGLHDLFTVFGGTEAIHNNALYLVGTKNLKLESNIINNISFHVGYGLDILQARTHNFVGFFGGMSIKFFNSLELMTEYDGKRVNGGLRLKLFDHISILCGYINYKYFSGGASFSFQL
ncbi:MAG: YjbH domain-containing protein [Melioribacteraceae bacterium]